MPPHLIGLCCPDCGHEWPGHAEMADCAAGLYRSSSR